MSARPTPAVSALIVQDHRILLINRGCEPNKGLWSLPGGSIELGETAREALVREVREETSLEIEPGDVAGVHDVIYRGADGIRFHYVVITFRARVIGGKLAAGSDAAETGWFAPHEIAGLPTTDRLDDILRSSGIH